MGLFAGYLFWILYRAIRRSLPALTKKTAIFAASSGLALLIVPCVFLGSTWMVALLYFVLIQGVLDLLGFLFRKSGIKVLPERIRAIFRSGGVAAVAALLVVQLGYGNMTRIVRTPYMIETDKTVREGGIRAIVLADLHYGISLTGEELSEVVTRINQENPDLVILCGDLVDESTSREGMEEAFSILGSLQSRYGSWFVFGNHDKQQYLEEPSFTEEELRSAITGNGIRILEDSTEVVAPDLVLVGRKDKGYSEDSRKSFAELTENLDPGMFWMVLDHQPNDYSAVKAGGGDLIVSGHTHGGQIWPAGWISELLSFNEMTYGLRQDGTLTEVVTSGIAGWGMPIRTEHHSEYLVLTIQGRKSG